MTVRHQRGTELTAESLARLLAFLNPDPDTAARKYEEIRAKLIRIFTWRGSNEPEELADETINRVAQKCEAVRGSYVGDPAAFFVSFVRGVFLESVKPRPIASLVPEPDPWEEKEVRDQCLERCLSKLTSKNRGLIIDYYRGERGEKIERRKELADRLEINVNTLRIRAHRLRRRLQQCLEECLAFNAVE